MCSRQSVAVAPPPPQTFFDFVMLIILRNCCTPVVPFDSPDKAANYIISLPGARFTCARQLLSNEIRGFLGVKSY